MSIGYRDCEESREEYECRGRVVFGNAEYPFIGKEMLAGAIFADSANEYRCNVENAVNKLRDITEFYIAKVRDMNLERCDTYYTNLITGLNNFRREIGEPISINVDEMNSRIGNIVSANTNLLGENCYAIF